MFGSSIYLRDRTAFAGGTPQAVYAELWHRGRKRRIRSRVIYSVLALALCWVLLNPFIGVAAGVLVAAVDFGFAWYGYQTSSVWRRGLRGDQRMNTILKYTLERRGHRVLHGRVVPGHGTADQIVVGPGGVWLVQNDAWHPGTEITAYGGKLFIDGRTPSKLVGGLHGAAEQTARLLSERTGTEVTVTPVLAVHGGRVKRPPLVADGITFAPPLKMLRWIRSHPTAELSPEDVETIVRAAVHVLPIGGRTMTST
ncbi:nuclease-related domain-containing protein [Actinomadura rayongensis]|uniref:nuclease-related domain-containing protein n=1 Tax=Actinomadura rayongensis TaxID=1429076 RepID=UPI001F19DAF9|nr:nuclease-related domain-containing protein [Actinomadura rayongensis]